MLALVFSLSGGALAVPSPAGAAGSSSRQEGIALYVETQGLTDQQVLDQARLTFAYCKSLGENAVALNFPFEVSSVKANDPRSIAGVTPSPELLGQLIALGATYGLSAQVRPLLIEANLIHSWRGLLAPTRPAVWFSNYWNFIQPYLQVAQSEAAGSFYISSELESLVATEKQRWVDLIKRARSVFSGPIYASTTVGLFLPVSSALASFDDYNRIDAGDSASIATVTHGIETNLASANIPGARSSLVLSEVGIAAARGAYRAPYDFGLAPPVVRSIQSRWFTAMCNTFWTDHLRGIYFWVLSLSSFSPSENDADSTTGWVGTASEAAIKACFSRSPSA